MRYFPIFLAAILSACASQKHDDYTKYQILETNLDYSKKNFVIQVDKKKSVDFRGIYNTDQSVEHGPIMYEGGAGAGGFLAQVLVHAAISSNMQNNKLSQQETQANKILSPFKTTIENLSQESLIHESNLYHFEDNPDDNDIILTSNPIFFLSQDMTSITLKNIISAKQKNSKNVIYDNLVEVISKELPSKEIIEKFNENKGESIKKMTRELYQHSLMLALSDLKGNYDTSETPHKNFRFKQGKKSRFERGASIEQNEDTSTIRNLRGWLISYPSPPHQ
jgi:hypothetical protein